MDDLLTTAEVAARLGVSSARVRRWIRDGHLVAHKHGRDFFVSSADLDRFSTPRRGRPHTKEQRR